MSRRTILLLAVVALFALALAACGGGAASSSSGGTALNVTITATEFKYDPAVINATPGQTINLTLKNNGSVQHTFVFATSNVKMTVDPGKSATQTFTAPASAGTYTFECDIAGHKEAGMVGQLIVK